MRRRTAACVSTPRCSARDRWRDRHRVATGAERKRKAAGDVSAVATNVSLKVVVLNALISLGGSPRGVEKLAPFAIGVSVVTVHVMLLDTIEYPRRIKLKPEVINSKL